MKKLLLSLAMIAVATVGAMARKNDTPVQKNDTPVQTGGTPVPSAILTPEQKVFGLSKFWREVNYNFVYFDRVDRAAWDSTYMALIPAVQKTANDWEYFRLLERFCAMLDDGHTRIYYPATSPAQTAPAREGEVFFPVRNGLFEEGTVQVGEIDGKIYVNRVNRDLAPLLPVRSEIVQVNGLPVEQYIARHTLPYLCQSTDHIRRFISVHTIMSGICGDRLSLGIRKPDKTFASVTLTFGGDNADFPEGCDEFHPVSFSMPDNLTELRWYGETAYVALNSFMDPAIVDEFRELLPELRRAKSLILDIRLNGGGNTGNGGQILEYLTPDAEMAMSRSRTRQNVAVYRAAGAFIPARDTTGSSWHTDCFLAARDRLYLDLGAGKWTVNVPEGERVIVPTVVLMGNLTASAAEDFLVMVDGQRHITTVGRPSFGSTGQPMQVELVGGICAQICTKDDTYPDGRAFVGVGIIPDIEVPNPTMFDLDADLDPDLEKALEFLRTKE